MWETNREHDAVLPAEDSRPTYGAPKVRHEIVDHPIDDLDHLPNPLDREPVDPFRPPTRPMDY
ncbi:MAG: hypothetical protein J4432_03685 [DPANN group archaeon]|nr:hypothetical protein [DPANN group archaeon]